jgi:arylsulfatase A-like enzyme
MVPKKLFFFVSACSVASRPLVAAKEGRSSTIYSTPRPPHIIFLLVDDLGWNNVPWNPHSVVKAPHSAALFAEGMSVPHAYVHRWCTPTRAALLTGRYAFRNGWNQYGGSGCMGNRCAGGVCCPGQSGFAEELSSVPLAFEMIPAMLKRAGYRTHMLGKWHLVK